jgi:hypothetical protein
MTNDEQVSIINAFYQLAASLNSQMKRNASYLARLEIEKLREQVRSNPNRLEQFGYKVYSQNDEDGILEEIFRRIETPMGSFCEIGVQNGLECNSLYLIHKGWRGSWLEADLSQKQPIEHKFGYIMNNKRLSVGIGYITPDNVNSAIAQSLNAIEIDHQCLDFLSIDIDGMDIYLLEALTIRPKVICIEYNSKFPPPLYKRPVFNPSYSWKGTDYMGASLTAVNDSAMHMGYTLVATNFPGVNAFFVRSDLIEGKFDESLTMGELYNPPRYHLSHDYFSDGVGHKPDFGLYTDLI